MISKQSFTSRGKLARFAIRVNFLDFDKKVYKENRISIFAIEMDSSEIETFVRKFE